DGLSSPTTTYGKATTALAGHLATGSLVPTGNVSITLNGLMGQAVIDAATGDFSATFSTVFLGAAASPYAITYTYAGDPNFNAAADGSGTLTVNKADQAITFGFLAEKTYVDPTFTVSGTASSELTVT